MDWEPYFGPQLALENFSHLMTVTSGGVEVNNWWTSCCTRQLPACIIQSVFPERERARCIWSGMLGAYAEVEDTFNCASRNLVNPARTVERISRLCPRLQRLKILANDVSFRQLEQLNGIEEVILSPFLSTFYPTFLFPARGSPHLDPSYSRTWALCDIFWLESEPHLSWGHLPRQLLVAVSCQHW